MQFYSTFKEKSDYFISGGKTIDRFCALIGLIERLNDSNSDNHDSNSDNQLHFRSKLEAKYKLYCSLQSHWLEKKLHTHYGKYSMLINSLIIYCKEWNCGLINIYVKYLKSDRNKMSYLSKHFVLLLSIYLFGTLTYSCKNGGPDAIKQVESTFKWSSIPKGSFIMGSPMSELNRHNNETQHQVTIKSFKISCFEVTVGQFSAFVDATGYITDADKMGGGVSGSAIWETPYWTYHPGVNWKCNENGDPLLLKDYNHPVIHVSWNDATSFAQWLGCRLPTEAEWEYSCRAGTLTTYNTGDSISYTQVNYITKNPCVDFGTCDSLEGILPVGSFNPNSWGLFDMHGNVWEWCSDYYSEYPGSKVIMPDSSSLYKNRVGRGGCWYNPAKSCRSANRGSRNPAARGDDIGFRIAKNI